MADTNKVWLSGVAASKPVLTRLPGKGLPCCWFDLLVREDFTSKGQSFSTEAFVRIEALGQQSDRVLSRVFEGQRYKVDGYLKMADGGFCIRAFAVYPDDSDEARAFDEGLRSALVIIEKSADIKSASEAIRLLLAAGRG